MANTKFLRCSKCGCDATPTKREVGTATTMRCSDCANYAEPSNGYATMCRECCPTGHGTASGRLRAEARPKPIDERCYCIHLRSQHANRFALGHGACTVQGCTCQQFTWKEFIYVA